MRGDYLIAAWHPQDAMAVAMASRIEADLLRAIADYIVERDR